MKKTNLARAIEWALVAIEKLTWAIQAETEEGMIEWTDKAIKHLKNSEEWARKNMPF